ncbi:DUF3263 domain-containing protein [Aurantimicrobium sp. MWH-Uga1]|uniref:DUF3263 domain-containing protein n=1 Tax=Aurantimicrobium sp. MWH-Uga1 TaxID=2079575 RepID=UPI000DED7B8C|nr:DUF3263 domain-containing protein [Aurantimicrobium sp. MWH-Uga1]AXE54003.1 hypothetical protein AURUGA1_00293 [Aurantimicrobium sp. MWH-Uga1]
MLDERDRAILDFEREWWERSGAKEDAIRQTFGLSPARYYQVLGTIMSSADALAYDPELVNRLQRVREERHRSRHRRVNPESSGKN